jgi:hypothetical protein
MDAPDIECLLVGGKEEGEDVTINDFFLSHVI